MSKPIVMPPDCETAIDALSRSFDVHIANSKTKWLSKKVKRDEALKAHRCMMGIEAVAMLIAVHQGPFPKGTFYIKPKYPKK